MNHTDRPENVIREGGTPFNIIEIERSRRQYMIRLGLTICFVLIFMDGGSQKAAYTQKEKALNGQNAKSDTKYSIRLNEVINSQRSLYTNTFASNLTGVFHGHWDFKTVKHQGDESTGTFLLQLRSSKIANVPDLDFVYGVVKVYKAGTRKTDLLYPVQGVYLATSGSLYLLSSMQASENLFLQLPEKETITKNEKNQILNLTDVQQTLLAVSNISANNSANKSKNHDDTHRRTNSKKRRRRPRSLADDSHFSGSNFEEKDENDMDLLEFVELYQKDWVLADFILTGRSLNSIIQESFFGVFDFFSRMITRDESHKRRLITTQNRQASSNMPQSDPDSRSELSTVRSMAVGSTGMFMKLIDISPIPATFSNGSSTVPDIPSQQKRHIINPDLMQAVGESSLPVSFKNLQKGMRISQPVSPFGAALGFGLDVPTDIGTRTEGVSQSCQFLVHMNVPPIEVNENKDLTKLFLSQVVSNISNSGTDMTADKYLNMKNKPPIFATKILGNLESPDCGVSFNVSASSVRMQLDEVERKAGSYSIIASAITFIQIGLLVVQLRYSSTPAALTKISILFISGQSLLDAALCIGHLVLCAALPQVFFSHFMWISILKLLLFGVFEMRTVVTIYQARYAQEIAAPGGLDGLRQRLAKVHLRFYAALFVTMSVALYCYRLPMIAVFIFYSYWIPQIVWNITSGTRRPFHPLYYLGITLTRLFIPLYILGCPHNFLDVLFDGTASDKFVPFSPASCIVLISWSMIQMSCIAAQDFFGPRFFLPTYLFPRAYDYFRPIPSQIFHGSLSHSEMVNSNRTIPDVESGGLIECVICYNVVETIRGTYMITPCDHVFHKECLSQWLSQKMECCICRSALPQLEE